MKKIILVLHILVYVFSILGLRFNNVFSSDPFLTFAVLRPPAVRACDWLPAQLQPGHAHSVPQQVLAASPRTSLPLPAAPAGAQTGESGFNLNPTPAQLLNKNNDIYKVWTCRTNSLHMRFIYFTYFHSLFLCFSGSSWAWSSQTCLALPPGGAGASSLVTSRQWIPGTRAAFHCYLQQGLYIVNQTFNFSQFNHWKVSKKRHPFSV